MKTSLLVLLFACVHIALVTCQCTPDPNAPDAEKLQADLDKVKGALKGVAIALPIVIVLVTCVAGGIIFCLCRTVKRLKKQLPGVDEISMKTPNVDITIDKSKLKVPDVSLGLDVGLELDVSLRRKLKVKTDIKRVHFKDLKIEGRKNSLLVEYEERNHLVFKAQFEGHWVVVRHVYSPVIAFSDDDDGEDDEYLRWFTIEAELRQRWNHVYLVKYVGYVVEPVRYCVITEYYTRGCLYDIIVRRKEKVELKKLLRIALQVSEAIQYLHHQKATVKTVSTRNVLVDNDWNGHLDLPSWTLTQHRKYGNQYSFVGDVAWQAPESLASREYTEQSDAFSFGVFLWELCAQEDPFDDLGTIQVACPLIHKGLRLTPPKTAPEPLQTLITECWAQSGDDRPQFAQIHQRLEQIHQHL